MAATHTATFKWPNTHPTSVIVTGTFDNWSGNTHHLRKEESGFIGTVELAYNQSYDFKYVVDGEWTTREDEGKSWDASGNVNNVYIVGAPRTPPASPPPETADAPKPVEASAPITHASLLASTIPGEASSIADSNAAVKDEPLVFHAPAVAAEETPVSPEEPTPAQAIVEQVHAVETPKEVEASPATTPKPIVKALEPIASKDGDALLDESTATIAAAVAAVSAGVAGLVVEGEKLIFGEQGGPVDKAAEDQTERLKDIDTSIPVVPVPATANYINQDADKAAPLPAAEVYSLGKVVDSEVEGASENGTVATDFSVIDAASTSSQADFEHVPAPLKLADEPAVVVPKPSEEKFEHVEKPAVVESTPTPVASSSLPEPLVAEVTPTPVHHEEVAPIASAPAPVEPTSSPLRPIESLTAPLETATPVPATVEPTPSAPVVAPATPSKSTPPASTNGETPSSTPVKAVPGAFPEASSVDSTPPTTPSKLSAKAKAEEEKLRKRKSSIFGKIGKMFGGGSKEK
ncbi:hypothetical protein BDY24DRAFT_231784 [Mrakia frigida]|uniref:uncharacterized protein n=1 Tax=Mrakia frigida TaxID=29902 RepID=UPI003FCC21D0